MAITHPRDFPDVPFEAVRCRFDREPLGAMSRSASGRIAFQEFVGGGLWEAMYQSKPLNETNYGRWHAWKLSMRGASRTFKGYDPRRCWPISYGPSILTMTRFGGGLFDGTVSLTAAAGELIRMGDGALKLPPGFILVAGDYVSFPWLGGQHVVKVLETNTANSSGLMTDIIVDPWLRTGGTVPVTATLIRPWCEMKIKPGSWSGDRSLLDPVSFEAIQHLT